jgi:hypothetical protein
MQIAYFGSYLPGKNILKALILRFRGQDSDFEVSSIYLSLYQKNWRERALVAHAFMKIPL